MYQFLLPESKPAVEERYRLKWDKVWPKLTFRYINLRERDVILNFLHGIIPTKSRLFEMKQNNIPMCPTCNVLEDKIHMFFKM